MQAEEEADRRFAVLEFCRGPDSNPAAKLLTAIGQIMFDPDGVGRPQLRLLHARFGPTVAVRPFGFVEGATRGLCTVFCQIVEVAVP